MKSLFLLILSVFTGFALSGASNAEDISVASEQKPFQEIKIPLSRPPDNTLVYPESIAINPDMTRIAYVAVLENEEKMQVVVNQTPGKKYDHIAKGYPLFSQKHDQVGYIAALDDKNYVVINSKEYPGYQGACNLTFSPDGNHWAYITDDGSKQFVIRDGQAQKKYDAIDRKIGIQFSPDSRHIAYVARKEDGSIVRVFNNKESRPYEAIKKLVFSPDSKHLACLVTRQKQYYTLRNNQEIGPYDMVDSPVWSPNSAYLAFLAIKADKWLINKNGQELPAGNYDILVQRVTVHPPWFFEGVTDRHRIAHKRPQTLPPKFSPDSSRLAWAINKDQKYRLCLDGEVGPLFDGISEPVFSPNSRRFAYIGKVVNEYIKKEVMMIDGEAGRSYDFVGAPVFSPDSKHLAYRAMKDGRWFVVRDGEEQSSYDAVLKPVFSGDSQHIAYAASQKKNHFMIFDTSVNGPYKTISTPFFSPDESHLIYIARKKNTQHFAVGNGQPGNIYFDSHIGPLPENQLNIPKNSIQFITPTLARTIVSFPIKNRVQFYQLDIRFSDEAGQ